MSPEETKPGSALNRARSPHRSAPTATDWGLLALLIVMWGSAFAVIEIALEGFAPFAVACGRILIAALVLIVLVHAHGRRLPAPGRAWLPILAMALIGNAIPFSLIAWGQQSITSAMTGVLMAVMPLVVIVLAHFFAGERLTTSRVIGFILGFCGVLVLLGPTPGGQAGGVLAARLAILLAAMCYAVNVIIARRVPRADPLVLSASVLLLAGLVLVPITLMDQPVLRSPDAASWAALIALGLLSTALATVVYYRIVSAAGAGFLSLINYFIPVWAVFLGAIALDERLTWRAFVALGIILLGVALGQTRLGQKLGAMVTRRA